MRSPILRSNLDRQSVASALSVLSPNFRISLKRCRMGASAIDFLRYGNHVRLAYAGCAIARALLVARGTRKLLRRKPVLPITPTLRTYQRE